MKKSQLKLGIALSYAGEGVKVLSSLLYTPIMLRLLGQSEYGLYQLVYSVVSYLGLLNLGFGSSYVRFYSRCKIEGAEDGVSCLNGMFLLIFSFIAVICLLCGSVLITNTRAIFGTGLMETELDKAKILLGLMVGNLAITMVDTVFTCQLTACECFLVQKGFILLQNVFNPFLTLPLLLLGYGSIGMVIVTTVLMVTKLIVDLWYTLKKMHMHYQFRGMKFSLLKEMGAFTFFIFINQIVDQVNWSVDKFLLGRLINTAAVAVYGIGGQLNMIYGQLSTAVSNVFAPKVNRMVAEGGQDHKLSVLFIRIGRIQYLMLALIMTSFTFFGQYFISIWGGDGYGDSYYVALWLMLPVTVPLIQNVGIEIQRAKNKHQVRSIVYFITAAGNVLISIPLIKIFGPPGAAAGTAIALTAGNILFMNYYYHTRLDIDIIAFWRSIGRMSLGLVMPVIVGILLKWLIPIHSPLTFASIVCVYVFTYCGSMWLIGMDSYEKQLVFTTMKKVLRKA